jgi:hypothetical protein
VSATVTDIDDNAIAGRSVGFIVLQQGTEVFRSTGTTDGNGVAVLTPPANQTLPIGPFTVVANIFGAAGQVVASDSVDVDTAHLALNMVPVGSTYPLGIQAVVTDVNGPAPGRSVRFIVSRNGSELYTSDPIPTTNNSGIVAAPLESGVTSPPAGEFTVVAELLDRNGQVLESATATKTIAGVPVTLTGVTPDRASARANTTYALATPISATVTDGYGTVPFYPVTFGFPTSGASATFTPQGGASAASQQIATDASGVATVPSTTVVKAGTTVGTFWMTVSAASTTSKQVPFAVQYAFGAFVSPVNGTTTTSPTGTTPVKIAALEFDGAKITDAMGSTIAGTNRFQLRWRLSGSAATGAWIDQRNTLTTYDTAKDFFQTDLKASSLGWQPGKTYIVQVRILPVAGSPQPTPAQSQLLGTFDLGTAQFTITVNKK